MFGTKPDAWSCTFLSETTDYQEWVREKTKQWRDAGMTHFRATVNDDSTFWLECWKVRPEKEAAFDPPYTAGKASYPPSGQS